MQRIVAGAVIVLLISAILGPLISLVSSSTADTACTLNCSVPGEVCCRDPRFPQDSAQLCVTDGNRCCFNCAYIGCHAWQCTGTDVCEYDDPQQLSDNNGRACFSVSDGSCIPSSSSTPFPPALEDDGTGRTIAIVAAVISNVLVFVGVPLLVWYCCKRGCCDRTKTTSQETVVEGVASATVTNAKGEEVAIVDNAGGTTINCCYCLAKNMVCRIYGGFVVAVFLWVLIHYIIVLSSPFFSFAVSASNNRAVNMTFYAGGIKMALTDNGVNTTQWCPFNAPFTADCPQFPVITPLFSVFLGLLGFGCFVTFLPLVFMGWRATWNDLWMHKKKACLYTSIATIPAVVLTWIPYIVVAAQYGGIQFGGDAQCNSAPHASDDTLLQFYQKHLACNVSAGCSLSADSSSSDLAGPIFFSVLPGIFTVALMLSIFFLCVCPKKKAKDDVKVKHVQDAVVPAIVESTTTNTEVITTPPPVSTTTTTTIPSPLPQTIAYQTPVMTQTSAVAQTVAYQQPMMMQPPQGQSYQPQQTVMYDNQQQQQQQQQYQPQQYQQQQMYYPQQQQQQIPQGYYQQPPPQY